jgi:hypothetical protein
MLALDSFAKAGSRHCSQSHLQVYFGAGYNLGIAEFLVPAGSFFQAHIQVLFHIIEELSPNVRMIQERFEGKANFIAWRKIYPASLEAARSGLRSHVIPYFAAI